MIFINRHIKVILILILTMFSFFNTVDAKYEKIIYDFKIELITGDSMDFSKYENKPILIVNVASKCGFTKQYNDLQKLWEKFKDQGLLIIAFPSNQFGNQEPGTNKEIKDFCETNFNITFPITTKVDVKGVNAEPIYKWAKENFGKSAVPKWNFYKILINKNGKIEKSYSSMTNPMSNKIINDIEKILN